MMQSLYSQSNRMPIRNVFIVFILIAYGAYHTDGDKNSNSRSKYSIQHEAFIKLINSSMTNNYNLLLICNDNEYFNNSIIQLNLIDETIQTSLKIYRIKSNGIIHPFNQNKLNTFKIQQFNGKIIVQNQNLIFDILYATGSIDIDNDNFSLVLYTSRFYIVPGKKSSKSLINSMNQHLIIENEFENHFISNLFDEYYYFNDHPKHRHHREKRNDNENNDFRYCGIKLLITYDLFMRFNQNYFHTIQHSLFVINFVNKIFSKIEFNDHSKLRMISCSLLIEDEKPDKKLSFNTLADIENYTVSKSDSNFCLSHIFTNHDLKYLNGAAFKRTISSKNNAGISSFYRCKNPWEIYCLLSVAHEFGHNFGSTHDYDGDGCFGNEDGSYIMSYPFLEKQGKNNFEFSSCSIRAIVHTINSKIAYFLKLKSNYTCGHQECGNKILEDDEECDEGKEGGNCCDANCKLRKGAQCSQSQLNALCCDSNCQIMDRTVSCLPQDLENCLNSSKCNGIDYKCPERKTMPDNTSCSHGFCYKGYCKMCEHKHIVGCRFCCSKNHNDHCIPNQQLPTGTKCKLNDSHYLFGQCNDEGECKELNSLIIPTLPSVTTPKPSESDYLFSYQAIIIYVLIIILMIIFMIVFIACDHFARTELDEMDNLQLLSTYPQRTDILNGRDIYCED